MTNVFDQMREAIETAGQLRCATRNNAAEMATFLPGNLDRCDHATLCKLKRELARYNIQTRKWRNPR